MILVQVTDDPSYPTSRNADGTYNGGVIYELSGNGVAWVRSSNVPAVYAAGGVRTVPVSAQQLREILWTKDGIGPSPTTAQPPAAVGW